MESSHSVSQLKVTQAQVATEILQEPPIPSS